MNLLAIAIPLGILLLFNPVSVAVRSHMQLQSMKVLRWSWPAPNLLRFAW